MVEKIASASNRLPTLDTSKPPPSFPHALTCLFYASLLENSFFSLSKESIRITPWHTSTAIAKTKMLYILCILNHSLQKILDNFEKMHEQEKEWRAHVDKSKMKKAQIAYEDRKLLTLKEELCKRTSKSNHIRSR